MNPQENEDFLLFESKVNQVLKILEDMGNATKGEAEPDAPPTNVKALTDHITEDNFLVTVRADRTVLNKSISKQAKPVETMDQYTFMQQVEQDAEERATVRRERERLAQKFREFGNKAFRKMNYERAINMYTKAIDHIKDSPILYNNRALCYMKMKNYKRGIMDCDYVVNKLEEKNLRSWLYRAAAFKRLGDDLNFEASIRFAKKHNSKEIEYIDSFVEKLNSGAF